jgi:hypothetical protein
MMVAADWLANIVANNFWGKEDAGVQPLLERMQGAKVTCDELKAFYNGTCDAPFACAEPSG